MPSPPVLSTFLSGVKEAFLEELNAGSSLEKWVVVVGNEAGDLDSIASAIGYAFYASQVETSRQFVPLVLTARSDLYLRPENLEVLFGSQISHSDLFCINDVADPARLSSLGASFALVDHNVLLPLFGPGKVTAIIDHHADENAHLSASPRLIRPVGSCSSLVTYHFRNLLPQPASVPATLADLLLAAVIIDTSLKPIPEGKAAAEDVDSATFLIPFSKFVALPSTWVKDVSKELAQIKGDVAGLSGRDLLRRDYKEYQVGIWRYGIATIPVPLSIWLAKSSTQENGWTLVQSDVEAYAKEHGLSMVVALTTYNTVDSSKKSGKGKHAREMLIHIADGALEPVFEQLENDDTLK
ncbi:hypothetical protein P7C70_g3542, partial [Phenoliferia sp. Uapishka_3]